MRKLLAVLSVLFYNVHVSALDLGIPIACDYGEDCIIFNYYDKSVEADVYTDHTCGRLSYDNHKSTDFMLRSHTQMKDGVNVVAADSGTIAFIRDGMSDISVDLIGEEAVRGSECGNGVIIDHKRGYKTEYCHLMNGSITKKVGDYVEKGEIIGQVGLSGITSFPYLEFTVSLNGQPVDPFTGDNPITGEINVPCDSLDIYPLWDKQTEKRLEYIATSLLTMGFSEKVPHSQGAREGKFSRKIIKYDSKIMVFWVDIFGIVAGDQLKLSIINPRGDVIKTETRPFTKNRRHNFQFIGYKHKDTKWVLGKYIGKVELLRKEGNEMEHVINTTTFVELVKN
ncbi:MAG: peptidase [Alphaproteobacteria bacterium CG11_big_fil_rev_8_21_14_0_20_39_49]|nr:MAG: peptidase [Alphaproteobacteria bacterium CG11_big_fil_rev_8_21_14_0_20_39_49]